MAVERHSRFQTQGVAAPETTGVYVLRQVDEGVEDRFRMLRVDVDFKSILAGVAGPRDPTLKRGSREVDRCRDTL